LTGDGSLAEEQGALSIAESTRSPLWRRASLTFTRDDSGRTYLDRQFAPYPFHFCKPFRVRGDPEGMATLYTQSCGGGIFQHDRLELSIGIGEKAQAHVTTSASTIVHSMQEGQAQQQVHIRVGPHALMEYLPEPLILFPRARLTSRVQVRLAQASCFMLSDAFMFHDPLGQGHAFDWLESETAVEDESGRIMVRDRYRISGPDMQAALPGVIGAYPAQGSFMCLLQGEPLAPLTDAIRQALAGVGSIYAGASILPGDAGVFTRILAADAVSLQTAKHAVWTAARRFVTGRIPAPRRK